MNWKFNLGIKKTTVKNFTSFCFLKRYGICAGKI